MSASGSTGDEAATPPWGEVARQAVFATTHWSVVLAAGGSNSPQAQASLEKLCQTYWYPLYAYVRRRGYSEADAKDLTQGFFAWLIERDWVSQADQQRGRFRSFLLTSISHFLANEWDKSRTQKRGAGRVISLPFDAAGASCRWEPADNVTPEQSFEWRWALTLLDQVMNRLLRRICRAGQSGVIRGVKALSAGRTFRTAVCDVGVEAGHDRRLGEGSRPSAAPALSPIAAGGNCQHGGFSRRGGRRVEVPVCGIGPARVRNGQGYIVTREHPM